MNRKKYIDLLKVLSAFFIVTLHVNSSTTHRVQNFLTPVHNQLSFSIHQLLYLSVPVFILLTGCGLFSTHKTDLRHMWPRIKKTALIILVFGPLFQLIRIFVMHEAISVTGFLSNLINGTSMSHMWYLNKLLGLYLITPILGAFLKNASRREIAIITGICFFFPCIFPFFAGYLGITYSSLFPIDGMFVADTLMGYLIETRPNDSDRNPAPVFGVGAIIGGVTMFVWAMTHENAIMLESHLFSAFTAICIVAFAKNLEKSDTGSNRFLETLSRCTLGIYIIHPLFIHAMLSFLDFNPQLYIPFLCVPATALVIFTASFCTVYVALQLKKSFMSRMIRK